MAPIEGECAICTSDLKTEDAKDIAALPCGHTYHWVCVNGWLQAAPGAKYNRDGTSKENFDDLHTESFQNQALIDELLENLNREEETHRQTMCNYQALLNTKEEYEELQVVYFEKALNATKSVSFRINVITDE
ncbi:unnamed protein product [Enterobius vermicularis]|uniref:RING-type domain-containing protein n=1 Tax=Enterobius vermicularis TaxID=51028 RepID=A0A0N4VNN8_ENTVE|nr:unnamed protein product [Enterobius vermicularis]